MLRKGRILQFWLCVDCISKGSLVMDSGSLRYHNGVLLLLLELPLCCLLRDHILLHGYVGHMGRVVFS